MAEVVCLGILVTDVVARPVDHYPRRGELVLTDELHPSIGGCAANTGISLQKLGVATAVMGKVGRDDFGNFVEDTLNRHGIETTGVQRDDKVATSATMVTIAADGERSFIHFVGANAALTLENIDWELVKNSQLLHIAGFFLMPGLDGEPCAQALKKARELGVATALDTAWDATGRWMEKLGPSLPYIDYFVPSYAEAWHCAKSTLGTNDMVDHSPEAVERVAGVFLDAGVKVVALKMGEIGSYVRSGQQSWWLPPFQVTACDATGAGDAFAAGFLAGVVRDYDLRSCAELGNAVGACCVTQVGTIEGILSLEETLAFIEAQKVAT